MADRPLRIISKFTRRFIADDESASVITDVDADDDGHVVSSGGCPPLNLVSYFYLSLIILSFYFRVRIL